MQTDGTKRRRLNGGAESWLSNGTIIEEDLTEGLSEDGAGTRDSLQSLGDRRRATLVNRDALFVQVDCDLLTTSKNLFYKASRNGSRELQEKIGLTPQRLVAADPKAPLV